jgi:arylsulfatase A-like enzyme
MNRRNFLGSAAGALMAPARKRPNIVVVLADDLGWSDVGCYGSEIRTPNLDRLAGKGVRFTQFYNTARCCPTRSSLLTGLYPHQTGIGHMVNPRPLPGYQGDLNRKCVTMAEALEPAGYQTMMCGKWHVARDVHKPGNWPLQRGFDKYYGIITGATNYFDPVTLVRDNTVVSGEGDGYYFTDALAAQAEQYVGDAVKKADPFLLYLAFTSPHWPLHAPEADIAKCKGRYAMGWDALRAERHKRQLAMGLVDKRWALTARDAAVPAWADAPDKEWEQRRMEVYAAQIECMDRGIGRVVKKLEDNGELDNTLILFMADNGGCAEVLGERKAGPVYRDRTRDGRPVRAGNSPSIAPGGADTWASYGIGWANASNTPFRLYKHWVHEGGISSPLIAHWPKGMTGAPGSVSHEPGHLIDVMATCLDVSGAKYPAEFGGEKITPLEGKSLLKPRGDRTLYWEHEGNRAVRRGKWKLVSRYPGNWELFDVEADRTELHDLAGSNGAKVAEMAAQYEAWAKARNVVPWGELPKAQA